MLCLIAFCAKVSFKDPTISLQLEGMKISITNIILINIDQVRSNHERLVAFCGSSSSKEKQKDSPLKLKSTADWKQRGKKQQPSHLPCLSPYHPQEFATSKLILHDTSYRVNNFLFFPFFVLYFSSFKFPSHLYL